MTGRSIAIALSVLIAAGACTDSKNRIAFDGKYFRAKVSKVDKQRDVFVITIKDAAQSIDGARAAGQHAGNAYCIENFGSSDIDWVVGPETPPEQLRLVDGVLTFQGSCPQAQ